MRHEPIREAYRGDDPAWNRVTSLSGIERLNAYVEQLNMNRWIYDSGNLYFVAKREKPDGTTEHFVDRAV